MGVQRQYTGTAGRIENAQVGVFLTYTTKTGHTLIDRELYLPASWTDDPQRCADAGIPADTAFATKTELAKRMIVGALDGGVPAGWVAGDEVYGASSGLRGELEDRGVGYVLAVCEHERGGQAVASLGFTVLCEEMEEFLDLRSRLVGGGFKPPTGALAEDRGLERCGKRRDVIGSGVGREDERWVERPSVVRSVENILGGIKTGVYRLSRDKSGSYPLTAQAVSGVQAA